MVRSLKRPGHATIVAYLALILAVGGGTFAVAKGVKINGAKLKKHSVAGAKLKKHTITGAEVNLGKLGKVPTARTADTAGTAGTAGTAKVAEGLTKLSPQTSTRVTSSATELTWEEGLAAATPIALYEDSHFKVYGKCFFEANNFWLYGEVLIATKQDGAIFAGEGEQLSGDPDFLDVATPEEERLVEEASVHPSEAGIEGAQDFGATAADGYSLAGTYQVAVKSGTLTNGNGLYGSGEVCIFSGHTYHS